MTTPNKKEPSKPSLGQVLAVLSGFALTAWLVGAIAFSQGVERERRLQLPATYADSAKVAAERACKQQDAISVFECVYEFVETSQTQAHAKQDLDAQKGMEFWAMVMAALTSITVGLTATGIWLLKGTLDATLQAVESTNDATKVMVDSNAIARHQLEASHRPKLLLATFGDPFVMARTEDRNGQARQLPVYVGIKARNIGVGACQIDEIGFQTLDGLGQIRERIGILLKSDSEQFLARIDRIKILEQTGGNLNDRVDHLIMHNIGTVFVDGHIRSHRLPNLIGFIRYSDVLDIVRERGFELQHSGRGFEFVEASQYNYDRVVFRPI